MTVIPVKGRRARADTVTVTRTTHTLPFDQLAPRDFERLCLWLAEREGFEVPGTWQVPGTWGTWAQRAANPS